MPPKDINAACAAAHISHSGNCSGAVRLIAKEMGYALPELSANGLVDYFENRQNQWSAVSESEAQSAADKGKLVIAGKKAAPNGHVVAVIPGGKIASGGFSYKDRQGKLQKAANHGSYPRACSTSLGGWPGAISKGDKTVFDSWGTVDNYKGVKYWVAPVLVFNFASASPGNEVVNRVPLLKNSPFKFRELCQLTIDVPVGTAFVVGGLHLAEKWLDLRAKQIYGLNLRLSAEEAGRFLEPA